MKPGVLSAPSVEISLSLIAGITVGRILGATPTGIGILTLVCVLAASFSRLKVYEKFLPPVFTLLGFVLLHAGTDRAEPGHIAAVTGDTPVRAQRLVGTVAGDFSYYQYGYRFTLNAERGVVDGRETALHGRALTSVYYGFNPPLPGDRVELRDVKLKPVESFRNVGGFDYRRYLLDKGIAVKTGAGSEKKVKVTTPKNAASPLRSGEEMRRSVIRYIQGRMPEAIAPLAAAMTVGVTGQVDPEVQRTFATSGLAHLLAISGLHVGFVTGSAYLLFYYLFFLLALIFRKRAGLSGGFKKPAVILSLFTGGIFVLSSGLQVSAMRAGIMVAVYLIALLADRGREVLNALAVSAIIILLLHPAALFHAGFQLSYLAVLGIILLFEGRAEDDPLEKLERKSKFQPLYTYITGTLMITVTVGLMLTPPLLAHFNEAHTGGFLANLLALPLATVAVPATLLGAVLDGFSPALGNMAAQTAAFCFAGIHQVALWFGGLSAFSLTGPAMPWWMLIAWYGTLALWLTRHRWRGMAAWALVPLFLLYYEPWPRQHTEVHFFECGQGDCTLVMLKDGANFLIDGGTSWGGLDIGRFVTLPAMHRLKVRHLDGVIATHGDLDHAGGLETVLKRMPVERFFHNDQPNQRKTLNRLIKTAQEHGIPVTVLRAGMVVPGSGNAMRTLHPDENYLRQNREGKDNDLSLVIMLESEGVRTLFTGDMERPAEEHLIQTGADIRADVLKTAHHGSRTSSSAPFLNAVQPALAVIPAGRHNRFHYPSKAVMKRMEQKGIHTLATNTEGEIVLRYKNGRIFTRSYVHPQGKEIKLIR